MFILHLVLLKTLPLQFRAHPNRKDEIKEFTICDGAVNLQEELKFITEEVILNSLLSISCLVSLPAFGWEGQTALHTLSTRKNSFENL